MKICKNFNYFFAKKVIFYLLIKWQQLKEIVESVSELDVNNCGYNLMLTTIKHSLALAQTKLPVFLQPHRPVIRKNQFMTRAIFRFYSSGIEHSFAARAAGQAKVKEFMKFVHPDLLTNAPDSVKQINT